MMALEELLTSERGEIIMRNRQCIIIMVLFIFFAAPLTWAQHHPGKVGMGLTVNGSEPGFILSFRVSPSVTVEPTFSMNMLNQDSGNQRQFTPGIGLLYQLRQLGDLRPLVGARVGLNILRTTVYVSYYSGFPNEFDVPKWDKYVDVSVGPVFGGRYYFSDHFAVSGEFQVKAIFYDRGVSGEDYRGVGKLSISTCQLLAAYLYF
jgi:hypothetical protein